MDKTKNRQRPSKESGQLMTLDRRDVDERHSLLDEDARRAKDKNEIQINNRLMNLLRKFRPLFKPEYTSKSCMQGLVGGKTGLQGKRLKAANAKTNAASNPINRKKKQDELRAKHVLELSKSEYKGEEAFGKEGAKTKADSIVLAIQFSN